MVELSQNMLFLENLLLNLRNAAETKCVPDGLCESQTRKQTNAEAFSIASAEDIMVGNV